MQKTAADFMQDWITDNIDPMTPAGSIDRLVVECIVAARVEGLSPAQIHEETGRHVRAIITEAVEQQLGV